MISVTDAIEELLYTKGGPCIEHRHKIAELLLAQETKILELTQGEKSTQVYVEPAKPVECSNCETVYDSCNEILRRYGKPCCSGCQETTTHKQDAWEKVEVS